MMCFHGTDEPCCGNCAFHRPVYEGGKKSGLYSCDNEDAEAYGFETDYEEACVDYESKKKGGE